MEHLEAPEGESTEYQIAYIKAYAESIKCVATFEGECGFGRECVGLLYGGTYPDYNCEDDKVTPPDEVKDAYHKHDCLAVLGRGPEAIYQLYLWVRKLRRNKVILNVKPREFLNDSQSGRIIEALFHGVTTPTLEVEGSRDNTL